MSEASRHSASRLFRRVAAIRSRASAELSPELEAAAAGRLGALALIVSIVGVLILALSSLSAPPSALGSGARVALIALDVAASLGLYLAIDRGRLAPGRALALGLPYQVLHGLVSGTVFYSLTLAPGLALRGWTSVAVWALLYPLIVPSSPRRVLVGTLLTAAMDPLALLVNVAAGAPHPRGADLLELFFPTAMVVVFGPIAARIVYGLTREVHEAREMGSYRLVEKLGQGGMGEVWRAEHRMLARGAAIKLIQPAALAGGDGSRAREMMARFEREAKATAALRSPHTIEVYDYGVSPEGTFHYVMELLEGFSLQQLVERFGPLPPERAVHLLLQACHSLAEAHAAGLVHRDVKPANLFVSRLGLDVDFVKVLDFGLVKVHGTQAQGQEALTMEGSFAGTPAYMPPEVALATEPVDGRADLYALGCVAHFLLSGRRVFESPSPMQMVVDHVRTPAAPVSRHAPQPIPDALERLILRCLEKDPAARPASAIELGQSLRALGLEAAWTEARAQQWWASHGSAEPGVDTGSDETRSELRPA